MIYLPQEQPPRIVDSHREREREREREAILKMKNRFHSVIVLRCLVIKSRISWLFSGNVVVIQMETISQTLNQTGTQGTCVTNSINDGSVRVSQDSVRVGQHKNANRKWQIINCIVCTCYFQCPDEMFPVKKKVVWCLKFVAFST